jgi:hypothetical protein
MTPPTPPKVVAVNVIATQPTDTDRSVLAHLSARGNAPQENVVFIVKIEFEEMPPATSHGWALYVKNERIPKYWAYKDGIYFKVYDPHFVVEHAGESLRFSLDGVDFIDTGKKLPSRKPKSQGGGKATANLPLQSDVLK